MLRRTLPSILALLALVAACGESALEPAPPEGGEGVRFSFAGSDRGAYESRGMAAAGADGLPRLEGFAVAQRDSVGGLILGAFSRTGDTEGDLFLMQIRGTAAGSYECGAVTGAPRCYGVLLQGVRTDASVPAERAYYVTGGRIELSEASESRLRGTFRATLVRADSTGTETLSVEDGVIDVPVVTGVFGSGFACTVRRVEEGPGAAC